MFYAQSEKVTELKHRLEAFMDKYVYPNEERFYKRPRVSALGRSILSSRS